MNACDCGGSDCTDNELPSDINNGSEPGSVTIDLTCNGLSIGQRETVVRFAANGPMEIAKHFVPNIA